MLAGTVGGQTPGDKLARPLACCRCGEAGLQLHQSELGGANNTRRISNAHVLLHENEVGVVNAQTISEKSVTCIAVIEESEHHE